MKLMSFNTQHCLNYIEQRIDFQIMADAIKGCGADIVGLNEMRDVGTDPEFEGQVAILSQKTGLEHYYFAKAIDVQGQNPYGNGILSKYPILQAETIPIPDPVVKSYNDMYESRCILKVTLENGITVLVSHFGLNPDEQKNAVTAVLENIGHEKCVLMGDFNVLPDNEVLHPIRACMKDTAELFDKPLYSFPSDQPTQKIDYIFVSGDINVLNADIPEIIASDHRPHTAEVQVSDV